MMIHFQEENLNSLLYSSCEPIHTQMKSESSSTAIALWSSPILADQNLPTLLKCRDGCRGSLLRREKFSSATFCTVRGSSWKHFQKRLVVLCIYRPFKPPLCFSSKASLRRKSNFPALESASSSLFHICQSFSATQFLISTKSAPGSFSMAAFISSTLILSLHSKKRWRLTDAFPRKHYKPQA